MNAMRSPGRTALCRWLLCALAGAVVFVHDVPPVRHTSPSEWSFGPRAASAAAGQVSVTINSSRTVMQYNYVEVDAALSGTVARSDGSEGTYKVPFTFFYPRQADNCNGMAILDVVNSVFYETFPAAGTASDPFFPSLFPFARLLLGDEFMFGRDRGGYVYAQVQWNKLVIERQRGAGTLVDPTLHIERGTDGYQIIADASRFLRNPSRVLNPSQVPCPAADVVGFGYSQTGQLLRTFYLRGLNVSLAGDPAFDNGLVFEGAIHAVGGGSCRYMTDDAAQSWYAYSMTNCSGATPQNAGKVFTINAETDVEILGGWQARGRAQDRAWYRTYEIAGAAHIPSPLFDLKLLGLKPAAAPVQNYADTGPVFRAMMHHLNSWITQAVEPPGSAVIAGRVGALRSPLFSERSWGNHGQQVYIADVGTDGNAAGGIRLVNVRTAQGSSGGIGGPLGISRGTECFNDASKPNYVLGCQDSSFYRQNGDASIYALNGGTFKPYTEFNPGLCVQLYPDRAAYSAAVTAAAKKAEQERWVLAEDVGPMLADAQSKAAQFTGCVPAQP